MSSAGRWTGRDRAGDGGRTRTGALAIAGAGARRFFGFAFLIIGCTTGFRTRATGGSGTAAGTTAGAVTPGAAGMAAAARGAAGPPAPGHGTRLTTTAST